MKNIFLALALMLAGTDARACSYRFPSAIKALNKLDMVFEGKIHAVYIDNKQVSTELLSEYLSLGKREATVRYKIIPSKMYIGKQTGMVELYTHFSKGFSCDGGVYIDHLWGAILIDGKLNIGDYSQHMALVIKKFLSISAEYQSHLIEAQTSEPHNSLIVRELEAVQAMLANELASPEAAFFSAPTELKALPLSLLKARAKFLSTDHAFAKEYAITTTAIALKD